MATRHNNIDIKDCIDKIKSGTPKPVKKIVLELEYKVSNPFSKLATKQWINVLLWKITKLDNLSV